MKCKIISIADNILCGFLILAVILIIMLALFLGVYGVIDMLKPIVRLTSPIWYMIIPTITLVFCYILGRKIKC